MGFFMSVSRESNFFFKHRVDQKYFLYIHEIKDICIRDLHWIYWARYDNATLTPPVLRLGPRIGPTQRMGAN